MKVKIDIDCTPEEARRFMGLPDVSQLQEEFLKQYQSKMQESFENMNPQSFMKMGMDAFPMMNDMQKQFMENMSQFLNTPSQKDEKK